MPGRNRGKSPRTGYAQNVHKKTHQDVLDEPSSFRDGKCSKTRKFVIDRYRQATAAIGYEGDTVVNSLGDILACGLGFVLAQRLGWRWSLAIFVAIEIASFSGFATA